MTPSLVQSPTTCDNNWSNASACSCSNDYWLASYTHLPSATITLSDVEECQIGPQSVSPLQDTTNKKGCDQHNNVLHTHNWIHCEQGNDARTQSHKQDVPQQAVACFGGKTNHRKHLRERNTTNNRKGSRTFANKTRARAADPRYQLP